MTGSSMSRREWLRAVLGASAMAVLPWELGAQPPSVVRRRDIEDDVARLRAWAAALRGEGFARADADLGLASARVGELALGTPYEPFTLEAYLRAGGDPNAEPLTLWLTRFDCVSLVESCLAIARCARTADAVTWEAFGREMERMRYRGGDRTGYTSRLHYFSEWIADNARRGLVLDLGPELGATEDRRPLRFMTTHRDSYPALADDAVFAEIGEIERGLDDAPRWVVPTARIRAVEDRLRTGDILAFATEIEGLDVTHTAFAYRDASDRLRVLHAPLSGGVVEITETDLHGYVSAIRRSTGILVARPVS